MNKIFKIVKNRSTGLYTVASELAKGAKKGSAVAGVALLLSAMTNANATGVPQGYTPAANDNQVGKVTIASSGTLDLGQDKGFASAQKGEEVKIHTLKSNSSITELYNTKYQAVADAQKEVDSKQAYLVKLKRPIIKLNLTMNKSMRMHRLPSKKKKMLVTRCKMLNRPKIRHKRI